MEEYRAEVEQKIKERKQAEGKQSREDQAVEKAVANARMDVPEAMIDMHVERMMKDLARRVKLQGLTMDQYFQLIGQTREKMEEELRPQALKGIQTRLVMEAIAKAENLEGSEERVEEEINKMAESYQMEVEKLKESISEEEIKLIREDISVQDAVSLVADAAVEE